MRWLWAVVAAGLVLSTVRSVDHGRPLYAVASAIGGAVFAYWAVTNTGPQRS